MYSFSLGCPTLTDTGLSALIAGNTFSALRNVTSPLDRDPVQRNEQVKASARVCNRRLSIACHTCRLACVRSQDSQARAFCGTISVGARSGSVTRAFRAIFPKPSGTPDMSLKWFAERKRVYCRLDLHASFIRAKTSHSQPSEKFTMVSE